MAARRRKSRHLSDGYRFKGFRPLDSEVRGVFGGHPALILPLSRRSKKLFVEVVALSTMGGTTGSSSRYEIFRAVTSIFIWRLSTGGWIAGCVAR
jgi:hypothetical protein